MIGASMNMDFYAHIYIEIYVISEKYFMKCCLFLLPEKGSNIFPTLFFSIPFQYTIFVISGFSICKFA